MIESFLKELKEELTKLNADNIDSIIENYREKCESLKNSGMSDIEIILNFGDTKELAYTICGYEFSTYDRLLNNTLEEVNMEKKNDKKVKSKSEVYISDALFFTPGIILSIAGTVALAFVSALALVVSAKYLYSSWVDSAIQNRGLAFTLAIFGVITSILGLFLTYILGKKVYIGSKNYFKERKEALNSLNNKNDNTINTLVQDKGEENLLNANDSEENIVIDNCEVIEEKEISDNNEIIENDIDNSISNEVVQNNNIENVDIENDIIDIEDIENDKTIE